MDVSHDVFGGGSLLCSNGAKRGENRAIYGAAVVEEKAEYLLY